MLRVVAFIALAAASSAPSLHASEGYQGQTLIDRGILTSLSERGALRLDLKSGALELVRVPSSKGPARIHLGLVESAQALAVLDFMVLGSHGSDGMLAKSVCAGEAANVTTAATLVTNSCGNGSSLACNSARAAFDAAVSAFNTCIANVGMPPVD